MSTTEQLIATGKVPRSGAPVNGTSFIEERELATAHDAPREDLTEHRHSLRERAKNAAAVAAKHASAVDEAARFPLEAVDSLKAQRLLGSQIPRELGGESASVGDLADVCMQLGQACSASAMVYAMHQIKIACLLRHRRDNPHIERLLRRISAEQLLLASSTTEGQSGGNVRSSEAPIEYEGDRISLTRQASVISYGAYADGIVTTARRSSEAADTDQVLVAFLKSDYSLTPLQTWHTLGMRGTCSEGYTLIARGTKEQILPDAYELIHRETMVPTAHLLWGSVWTGIAAGATARAQSFIRHAARRGGPPPGTRHFTQALNSLRTLRCLLSQAIASYEQCMQDRRTVSSLEFQSMITATKVEASEMAVTIVMLAMRVCGLSGYRCDGEFSVERHVRDILSSPLMINNERILSNLGNTALMTAIPESIR